MQHFSHRLVHIVVAAAAIGCSRAPEPTKAQQASGLVAPQNTSVSQSRQNAITAAVAKISPSVVTVQTEAVEQAPQDPFDMFFGGSQRPRTQADPLKR